MNPLRLAFLTRSFWPIIGPAETKLGLLASDLQRAGNQVRLFTSQWEPDWSPQLAYREVPVTRVSRPKSGVWSQSRFLKGLANELASQCPDWDAVVVSGHLEELEGALRARRAGGPRQVFFRLDGKVHHQIVRGNVPRRRVLQLLEQTDGIFFPHSGFLSAYSALGADRLHVLGDGILETEFRPTDEREKRELRSALGEVHPLLQVDPREILGIYTTDFEDDPVFPLVLGAWAAAFRKVSGVRLWLVGDGPQAAAAWQLINNLGISHSAILVGNFDHLADPLRAADFFIQALGNFDERVMLFEALACQLPVIYPGDSGAPECLAEKPVGLEFQRDSTHDLARQLEAMVQPSAPRQTWGLNGSRAVRATHSMPLVVEHWKSCLRKLGHAPQTATP